MDPVIVETNYCWQCPKCGEAVLITDVEKLDKLTRRQPVTDVCSNCGHETKVEFRL